MEISFYLGIDLSGPGNGKDTAAAAFCPGNHGKLKYHSSLIGADDHELFSYVRSLEGNIIAGIDAPLSYNPGGGDRPGDKVLRKLIVQAGLPQGSVMPPTMTRMVYLTLRGISVARFLSPFIYVGNTKEVHPIAAMALRGAPISNLAALKQQSASRVAIIQWLIQQGMLGADRVRSPNDHYVAACGCALAVREWHSGQATWCQPAQKPFHPFDYIC